MPFLYIDDIILIANKMDALERYIMLKDAVKNPMKVQESATSVRF